MGLRLIFDVFKLRIALAIGCTALLGAVLARGPAPAPWRICALVLAVTLTSAAAGAYNQLAERFLDARMERTQARAFASGRWQAGAAWTALLLGLGAAGIALAAWCANAGAALYTFLGGFTYAIVYTRWLKPRTHWNIVIGGLAGSFAVLAGAAAVAPQAPQALTLLFALILFLWTPPHFWSLAIAYREQYQRAGVPMLPVVVGPARAARIVLWAAVALVATALLPLAWGMGLLYLLAVVVAGGYLLTQSARLARCPVRERALRNFTASLFFLGALALAAFVEAAL